MKSAITLVEAAAYIASSTGCRRPHVNTVYRWATRGVGGERLHTFRVGRVRWTTRGDVADFLRRTNAASSSPAAAAVADRQEQDHAAAVRQALAAELGIVQEPRP